MPDSASPDRPWRASLTVLLALAASACELTETTTARGADLPVVEAVLRAEDAEQRLLLHRTLEGRTVRGEAGAQVRVRAGRGREVAFQQVPSTGCYTLDRKFRRGEDSLRVEATCYASAPGAGAWVVPGEEYELAVVTRRGERLRGRTRVPGAFDFAGLGAARLEPQGDRYCTLPPDTPLPLTWTASRGAWAYVTEMEVFGLREALAGRGIANVPEPLELLGVSVSEADTTLVLPAQVGLFDRFSQNQELLRVLQDGFPEGVMVVVTVSAADRNFVNSVRGGAFNPSGNVHVSSVVGDGLGVFGSIVVQRLHVEVRRRGGQYPCLAR